MAAAEAGAAPAPQGVTASSVAVYTAADIRQSAARNAFDVFRSTPNVDISRDQRDVVIRGVNKSGFNANEDVLAPTWHGAIQNGVANPQLACDGNAR